MEKHEKLSPPWQETKNSGGRGEKDRKEDQERKEKGKDNNQTDKLEGEKSDNGALIEGPLAIHYIDGFARTLAMPSSMFVYLSLSGFAERAATLRVRARSSAVRI